MSAPASLPTPTPDLPAGWPLLETRDFPPPPPPLPPPPAELPPLDPADFAPPSGQDPVCPQTAPPGPRSPEPTPVGRRWWVVGGGATVILATVVALLLLLVSGSRGPSRSRPAPLPTAGSSTTLVAQGQAVRAFAAANGPALQALASDVKAVDQDSQGALEGDYGPIAADARRLVTDVIAANAVPAPAEPAAAAQWFSAIGQLTAAADQLAAAAAAGDAPAVIDALEAMGPAGFALAPFTL